MATSHCSTLQYTVACCVRCVGGVQLAGCLLRVEHDVAVTFGVLSAKLNPEGGCLGYYRAGVFPFFMFCCRGSCCCPVCAAVCASCRMSVLHGSETGQPTCKTAMFWHTLSTVCTVQPLASFASMPELSGLAMCDSRVVAIGRVFCERVWSQPHGITLRSMLRVCVCARAVHGTAVVRN